MAAEQKTVGTKVETTISATTHKKFKAKARKLGVSMAQRVRDLIQKDLKG